MEGLLEDLNDAQRRAVLHSGGPLLVLAGPGSGKTRVIVRRIEHRILDSGTSPARILAITFTHRAADEIKARLTSALPVAAQVRVGTFHWVCSAFLRRHSNRVGYRADFRLLKPREARQFLRTVLERLGEPDLPNLAVVAGQISRLKNVAGAARADVAVSASIANSQEYLRLYEAELRRANAMDLDDLLFLTTRLLEEDSRIRDSCRMAYEEILVDEYQDVNPVQHRLLELLLPCSRSFTAVGDEDQAIYGWRAADIEGILRFGVTFPDARTVKLEESYRSTKHILRAAQHLVAHNKHRIEKPLRTANKAGRKPLCFAAADEREESDWIASQVADMVEQRESCWADFCVLYRTNAQSRVLEDAFLRRRIPYRIHAAKGFYEQPEIRRALAFLKLTLDPVNQEATRLLLGQQPGIGPGRLQLLEVAAKNAQVPLITALRSSELQGALSGRSRPDFMKLVSQIDTVVARRTASLLEQVTVAAEVALVHETEAPQSEQEAAKENLAELCSVAHEYEVRKSTLRAFLESLESTGRPVEETNSVSCMSIHAAKGLEFSVVFIAGLEEDTLPHRRAVEKDEVEEERRLCYVGMTRAQEILILSYARTRKFGDSSVDRRPSRFLGEIGGDNLTLTLSPRLKQKPRGPGTRTSPTGVKEEILAG